MGLTSPMVFWLQHLYLRGLLPQNAKLLELGPQDIQADFRVISNAAEQLERGEWADRLREPLLRYGRPAKRQKKKGKGEVTRVARLAGRRMTPRVIRSIYRRRRKESDHDNKPPQQQPEIGRGRERAKDTQLQRYFYSIFGVSEYTSLDLFDPRADHRVDLNLLSDISGDFDLVTNFGTAEHVYNIGNVFANIHNYLKVGGVSLHALPAYCDINHGFYNIHPILYLNLSQANNYRILHFAYVDDAITRAAYLDDNPDAKLDFAALPIQFDDMPMQSGDVARRKTFRGKVFRNLVENYHSNRFKKYGSLKSYVLDYCYVALQKTEDKEFVYPTQSPYMPDED